MNKATKKAVDDFVKKYDNFIFEPWQLDETGVWKTVYNKNTKLSYQEYASHIPLCPTAILRNIDTGIEKVELSFYKFGKWEKIIVERSISASRNSIIKLADRGIEVNSDNCGKLVSYIADIVSENQSLLPCSPSKSVMGWFGNNEFMPYSDSLIFDGEQQFKHLYEAIATRGELSAWVKFLADVRKKIEVRLCMAASFASPIVELVGENPFIFHLWGETGMGKTLCLMIAMSIWGDPSMGKMTRTMNMTINSMMATAGFLRHLPFAGDELQTIKLSGSSDNYDTLIMRITEGIDRGRMNFDRVNETRAWRNSFIFTGEEPCVKASSGGGAKNRVIEVNYDDKLVINGNLTANFVRRNYGTAGRTYIEELKKHDVIALYNEYFTKILENIGTTDKQAGAMALMLTADKIASKLFWSEEDELTIDDIKKYLSSAEDVDVAERAYQYICGAIAENQNNFSEEAKQMWGRIDDDNTVFINKNVLCRILSDGGYDFDAVKQKWANKGRLIKDKGIRYFFSRSINRVQTRYVCLKIGKIEKGASSDELLL